MKEWKYRVIRTGSKEAPMYRIYGVKYAPDGSTLGHTTEPVFAVGASAEELVYDLAQLRAAFLEPILDGNLKEVEAPYVASSDIIPKEPKKVEIVAVDIARLREQIAPLFCLMFVQLAATIAFAALVAIWR